jgi:hypothetical protein
MKQKGLQYKRNKNSDSAIKSRTLVPSYSIPLETIYGNFIHCNLTTCTSGRIIP